MEVFKFEKNGGFIFVDSDGFCYVKGRNKLSGGVEVQGIRCQKHREHCRANGILKCDQENYSICEFSRNHSCMPLDDLRQVFELRNKILDKTTLSSKPLSHIFNEECSKYPPSVAKMLTFPSLQSSMRRRRNEVEPPLPRNLDEYAEIIQEYPLYSSVDDYPFFRKSVGELGSTSVLFFCMGLRDQFKSAQEVHIDATFKVVPKIQGARQLMTIMFIAHDHAFPVLFALMESKTTNSYVAIFEEIKREFGDAWAPKIVMSDFENSIKNAVLDQFPTANHVGCWFHYSQAILRRFQTAGLIADFNGNSDVKKIGKMLMALALLPHHMILEGYNIIEDVARDKGIANLLNPIFRYFHRQWIVRVGPKSFSVYGQLRRTNNAMESYHSHLKFLIGTEHPNVWKFTRALLQISSDSVRNYLRCESGVPATQPKRKIWLLQDKIIAARQRDIIDNRISITEFLSQLCHRICSAPLEIAENDEDEELISLSTLTLSDDEYNVLEVAPAPQRRVRRTPARRVRRTPYQRGVRSREMPQRSIQDSQSPGVGTAHSISHGEETFSRNESSPVIENAQSDEVEIREEIELGDELVPEIEIVEEIGPQDELMPEMEIVVEIEPQNELMPEMEIVGEIGPQDELVPEIDIVEVGPEDELVPFEPRSPQVDDNDLYDAVWYDYAIIPTVFDASIGMLRYPSNDFIRKQRENLWRHLISSGNEGTTECSGDEETTENWTSNSCLLCLTNIRTRICSPCGHLAYCRTCAEQFINQERHAHTQNQDGTEELFDVVLPWVCPICRALIAVLLPKFD